MIVTTKNIKLKTYKDLIAWQKSYKLCLQIYAAAKLFPKIEQFGLTSQLKRSAVSVPSNIAEGYTRRSTNDYLRFLYMAYSSLAELETQLMLAKDLNYIGEERFSNIRNLQNEVQRIMYGLIKSIKSQNKSQPLNPLNPKPLNPQPENQNGKYTKNPNLR